jgi:hypothetical protein
MKNAAAVTLGRLGGLKGGKARAAALTPARRSAIARQAVSVRWGEREKVDLGRLHDDRVYRCQVAAQAVVGTSLDAGDVEHALFNLTLSPQERLKRGLFCRS